MSKSESCGTFKYPKSILELGRVFHSDECCLEYLYEMRFPDGFECENCGGKKGYPIGERKAIECAKCGEWTYLTAGTVMEKSKTSLCKWFTAAYLMTTQTPGMSAVQFQKQVGIPSYEAAFNIMHKLRAAMVVPDRDKLEGVVEVDESYIGGHRIGGKSGRGAEGKALVVGAVEVVQGKKGPYAGRIRLKRIEAASYENLSDFIVANIERGTTLKTDGWAGYEGIDHEGYEHRVLVEGKPEMAHLLFPHIHRIFGNVKAWIIGTHHGVSPKHIQAYLNEYVFRFNRRFKPWEAFNTVLGLASDSESPTYEELYAVGEKDGWEHPI